MCWQRARFTKSRSHSNIYYTLQICKGEMIPFDKKNISLYDKSISRDFITLTKLI